MATHAILSPSGSIQWMACAGSLFMQAGEEDRTSVYAETGDAMHKYASACLTGDRPASAFIGRIFTSEEGLDVEVDDEAAGYMQMYLDRIAEHRRLEMGAALVHDLYVEQRVYYGAEIGQSDDDAFGTSDAIVTDEVKQELIVDDLKWGVGVRVFAKQNTQLMLYALGSLRYTAPWFRPKTIRICVTQPRLNVFDEWTITTEELEKWAGGEAAPAAQAALAMYRGHKPPVLKPGQKQCRFCAARSTCPEARNVAVAGAVEGFEDVDDVNAANIKTKPVAPMSLDELVRSAALVPFIEDWCRAVTGRLDVEFVQRGAKHPLFKVVRGKKGARYWHADHHEDVEFALALDFPESVTHEPPKPAALKTPAALEKVSALKKSDAWKALQGYIGQEDGKLAVVPSTDGRPEVSVDPTGGFADVTE